MTNKENIKKSRIMQCPKSIKIEIDPKKNKGEQFKWICKSGVIEWECMHKGHHDETDACHIKTQDIFKCNEVCVEVSLLSNKTNAGVTQLVE